MKKSIMLVACMSTAVLHGMEVLEMPNSLIFNVNETMVYLHKGHICQANGEVSLMVLGRNEQQKLQAPNLGDSMHIGKVYGLYDYVMVKHKGDESASLDDSYRGFDWRDADTFYKKAERRNVNCRVLTIVEPRIFYSVMCDEHENEKEVYTYCPLRDVVGKEKSFSCPMFLDDEAVKEAQKDIDFCCHKALMQGLEFLKDTPEKKIAIDAFGSSAGVPRKEVALAMVPAIFEFTQKYLYAYSAIHLFVKKRSEMVNYKKLFEQYTISATEKTVS